MEDQIMSNENKPASALSSPRFCNTGNFMRIPRVTSLDDLDFCIVGIPFDTASSYRSGSRFGPSAIRSISAMMKPNNVIHGVNILEELNGADYGDINITPGYILPSYEAIEREMQPIVDAGIIPIGLGGDHSVTLAEMRAVAKKHGKLAMVHFDSHADINDQVFGEQYNHGTPFRRSLEEELVDSSRSIQIGMRGSLYDPNEHQWARDLGYELIPAHEMFKLTPVEIAQRIKDRVGDSPVFLTFDIDFVDPAYAPGTGTPEVGGPTSREALNILRELKGLNFVAFDVVEVLPAYDHGEITSYLAANICFEFISLLALQKKDARTMTE